MAPKLREFVCFGPCQMRLMFDTSVVTLGKETKIKESMQLRDQNEHFLISLGAKTNKDINFRGPNWFQFFKPFNHTLTKR